jgi:hypothetical protein
MFSPGASVGASISATLLRLACYFHQTRVKFNDMVLYDIFNSNLVDTQWQQYSTRWQQF